MKKTLAALVLILTACTTSENLVKNNETDIYGMYIHYAGNAELIRCDNNQRIFIKGGKAQEELEKRYNQLDLEDGQKVYVEVNGRYEVIEVGAYGSALVFYVDEIYKIDEEKVCADGV